MAASAAELGALGALTVLLGPLGDDAQNTARNRTLAALSASGPRGRAMALLWQGPASAELVSLAQQGNDPAVYSLVLGRCELPGGSADCKNLSAQEWVRREPKNAAAWLHLAASGVAPGAASVAEADLAAGLLQSNVYSKHHGVLAAATLAAIPADVPAYVRFMLIVEAIGVQGGIPNSSMFGAFKRCKPAAGTAPARQSECDHVANLLVHHSDSLNAHQVGTRVGKLLGWPQAKVAALEAEETQMTNNQMAALLSPQPLGCAVVEPLLAVARNSPQQGEMAAWRAYAEATAKAPR